MAEYDWSQFKQKIYISAPIQAVYEAWTTRSRLEQWFLRKAEFTNSGIVRPDDEQVQKGDVYDWTWHGHPDTSAEQGEVLKANGADEFRFTFSDAGIVTVMLTADGTDTELSLIQTNIPTDDKGRASYYVGCSVGWTFYMANLKSVLEGGLDLRNKDMARKGVINS